MTARDDYGAELWVRGASWDQTRIFFDGVPLFNPVHGFGLLSAVNTDAVGGALLHPGVQSAALGSGAAAVLDVSSRSGRDTGRVNGTADLSLASGRLALDGGAFAGRGAWMVAGRRSWLDLAAGAASLLVDDPQLRLPYSFADLTGRIDLGLSGDRAVELSALHERDRLAGTIPDIRHRTHAAWGNTAVRLTYASPVGSLRTRTTIGLSLYGADTREAEPDPDGEGGFSAPADSRSDNSLTHLSLSGELEGDRDDGRVLPWRAGYAIVHERGSYEGPEGYAYNRYRAVDADSALQRRAAVTYVTLWSERRWELGADITLETGLRLEAGPGVRNGGAVRAMPRVTTRYTPTADLSLSAGVGRSYQYSQALAGAGPMLGAGYAATRIWLIADEEAPAIRADVATLGAELWLADDWLLGANVYARHSTGVALPDPTPGLLVDRPLFVAGENTARGVELSARRLAGHWTASGSYSFGSSEMDAAGLRFPALEDRRHAVDLTSMLRLGDSFRVGGAFTYASGAPYTRIHGRIGTCTQEGCEFELLAEAKNAHRASAYASLDLLVDWTKRLRQWELGAYLQLRNALGHSNDVTISSTTFDCISHDPVDFSCAEQGFRDQFQQGLPMLPVIGFRARF